MNDFQNTMPLASIIMSCYNGCSYIERAFHSILSQTYPAIELVFVDDGSTDDSYEVAISYKKQFEQRGYKLCMYKQENQGLGFACINMIAHATGKYLSYLDVDDEIPPTSIEKKVLVLEENKATNVVRTNAYKKYTHEGRKVLLVQTDEEKQTDNLFDRLLLGKVTNYAGTYMVRTETIRNFYKGRNIPQSRYGQNLQLLLPTTYKSNSLFIDEPLFIYNIHQGSHSEQKETTRKIELLQGYEEIRYRMMDLFDDDFTQLKKDIHKVFVGKILDTILTSEYTENISKKKVLFNQYYHEYLKTGGSSIEYKMHHAILNGSAMRYYYRLMLAISNFLK